jgi:hypothetical protein
LVNLLLRWSRRLRGLSGGTHAERTPEGVVVTRRYAHDGRLEEESYPRGAPTAPEQVTRRFDAKERLREIITTDRTGRRIHVLLNADGTIAEERTFESSDRLLLRRSFAYVGDKAFVTTYDGDGKELSRTEDPRHSM